MIGGPFFPWKAVSFAAVVIVALICGAPQAKAQRIVAGTVTDALTGTPIPDAVVTVKYLDQELGKGTTDGEGHYRVPFGVPPPTSNQGPVSISLSLSDGLHKDRIVSLQVVNGHAVQPTNDVALLIPAIASCPSSPSIPSSLVISCRQSITTIWSFLNTSPPRWITASIWNCRRCTWTNRSSLISNRAMRRS